MKTHTPRRQTRREFLIDTARLACAAGMGTCALAVMQRSAEADATGTVVSDAMFFKSEDEIEEGMVRCSLCPNYCAIGDGGRGRCEVRENRGGKLKTLVYGALCSMNIDPIEKKPLFHYLPGTTAMSVATAGCNIECKFCQNWQISQFPPEKIRSIPVTPKKLVEITSKEKVPTIAYTYSEPVIFYEYMHDTAKEGRKAGIGSVMISNGFINEKPMRQVCEHLTAVKVDLKAFTETFYREVCGGKLKPVLKTLEVLKDIGIHLEIVVLIVPTLNDDEAEIRKMAKWIVKTLGPDVPLHFSRFHPMYRIMNLPQTPLETLNKAHAIATAEGCHYVYIGNVPFSKGQDTICPKCSEVVIGRMVYKVTKLALKDGKCPKCGTAIPGIWTQEEALAAR